MNSLATTAILLLCLLEGFCFLAPLALCVAALSLLGIRAWALRVFIRERLDRIGEVIDGIGE